ncbi:SRPBCC domain-containing protein [Pseudarthrobacter sp. Fe7]|nr:SRPBCC domain-containing protein [Pseudarthrobacter sp. Fe7]
MTENAIRLERRYPHPVEAVWAALTTPELLARWWAPGNIAPVVGHRFIMDMDAWGQQQCEVTAVDPGKSVSFLFSEGQPGHHHYLAPGGRGRRHRPSLRTRWLPVDTPMGRHAIDGMGNGWPGLLARIDGVLAGVS